MSTARVAGALLIGLPLAFNLCFFLLARSFDYPDILRRPTSEVLARFRAGGAHLLLLWWAFSLTAVLLVPLAVLLAAALVDANRAVVVVAATTGVLAGVVQFLGLIRWPFLVPCLARADADASPARREAIDIVFQSFNRYLGVAVGEHLGYLFTGGWSVLSGVALIQATNTPGWLGVAGIVVGGLLMMCSFEFVGAFEQEGWKLAATLTPIAYVAWSIWLVAVGVALIS
ncbi:DUF4386 domain-containing protein [Promicromonospora soli]|uniref:DUF4386 domain-containing protein n=1 Tax=Promicromonospora soli TaxID=2035533 RepID=A0A919G5H1_9MICO|nr:DUF4386 domain-containing protein [Promicromonospora soli]GHH78034.1 hypothetical protein GCM10017772_40580 [Promicromonospora soli]